MKKRVLSKPMCKLINLFLVIVVFTVSLNVFAMQDDEAVVEDVQKPVRIGFFIGTGNENFGVEGRVAITYDFACAISQRALDVAIVSDYVLKNLILRKYTKIADPILEKDRNDFDHTLEKIDFDLSEWDFYSVQNTQFFVLLKHNYDSPILNKAKWTLINILSNPEYNGSGEARFPAIPWASNAPSVVKRLLSDEKLKYIPYAKNLGSPITYLPLATTSQIQFNPTHLALIFNPVEDYEKLSQSQPCNIFMSGHAAYSANVESSNRIAGLSCNDMASTLLFFNDKMNTKSVRLSTCAAGGRILDLIQIKKDLRKKDIPVRIKYLLIVDSITDAPTTSDWKKEISLDVGLKGYFDALEIFQRGYKMFGDTIGALRAEKNRELEQAIKDKAAKAEIKKIKNRIAREIKAEAVKLESVHAFRVFLNKLALPKNWYLNLLGPNSFPQFWIPEVGWFQTFNINSSVVQRITDATIINALAAPTFVKNEEVDIEDTTETPPIVKKVIIKSRLKKMNFAETGAIDVKGKLALLLYSEVVFANMNIISAAINASPKNLQQWHLNLYKYFPSIPCLDSVYSDISKKKDFYVYPQIISMQHGDSLNLFSKITLPPMGRPTPQNGILNFLRDSFLILRDRISTKTFFIKELEGYNDFTSVLVDTDDFAKELGNKETAPQQITLQNVFIETSLNGKETCIKISFEFNKKAWVIVYGKSDRKKLDLEEGVVSADKGQSLWCFKQNVVIHEGNLRAVGLTYLSKLTLPDYSAQLLIIRDLFKKQITKTFKEFLVGLKPEEIIDAMKKTSTTRSEWTDFEQQINQKALRQKLSARTQLELRIEQQFRLKMNLKRLKISLGMFKQKLELLSSKLQQLSTRLAGTI